MARPAKLRCIEYLPSVASFRPMGVPASALESVSVTLEEAESIRLRDLEDLEQDQCAARMRVSRPTFHRILESARRKLADALINGKAIEIEGGNFELAQRRFRCGNDGHEWHVPFEIRAQKLPISCPVCFSGDTEPTPLPLFGRGRRCRRRFRGGRRQ